MLDKSMKILVVGLGVIGGGYAAALTAEGYDVRCITKEQRDIDYALDRGMISFGTTETDEMLIKESGLVIFALYPTVFIKWIEDNQRLFAPGTVITDVTGVKSAVVERVQSILRNDVEFIAAHPMAGRERSGVEYSDPSVFRGANYIITPTEKNTPSAIAVCKALGQTLGFAKITELTPAQHDEMIAFLSQLTHVIAVTLMNCCSEPNMEKYTGDSFRDLTRIAKINDRMWSELFLMNKDALLRKTDDFIEQLTDFRSYLADGNEEQMRHLMRCAAERRALFDKPEKM